MVAKETGPTVWTRYLPQVATVLILAVSYYLLLPDNRRRAYIYYAVITYLVYTLSANLLVPVRHRRGVRALRQGRYAEAIAHFQKSRELFERHAWLDRYRSLVLMASTRMSYRESALTHTAVAYAHLGEREQALRACREILRDYPANAIARRITELGENNTTA